MLRKTKQDLRKAYHCIEFEEEMQYYAKRNYKYQDPEFVEYWINRHTTNDNIRMALRCLSLFNYEYTKGWVKKRLLPEVSILRNKLKVCVDLIIEEGQ